MPANVLAASHHIRIVGSFDELVATRFEGEVNALCWPRTLPGDFQEIVAKLGAGAGITSIDDDDLHALELTEFGAVARSVLLADQELLRANGLQPVLDCVTGEQRIDAVGVIATDVTSFHADSATVEADTYLCTYAGAPSEGLANASAIRRADDPHTRAALLAAYGGKDDDGFAAYLSENCYDLHYAALPGAAPYTFGVGNLWRIAIVHPESRVPPCIHRAPLTSPETPPRLLLLS